MPNNEKSWIHQAACRLSVTSPKNDIFFEDVNGGAKEAKKICDECPVRRACLQYALDNKIVDGVWGGVDENELRRDQSMGADGKRHDHSRPIRCPWCGPNSTRYLRVQQDENGEPVGRLRTKTLIECTNCHLQWATKKLINKRRENW